MKSNVYFSLRLLPIQILSGHVVTANAEKLTLAYIFIDLAMTDLLDFLKIVGQAFVCLSSFCFSDIQR